MIAPPPETRLAFWSLAYLVVLHRDAPPEDASNIADEALFDFDSKAKELLNETSTRDTTHEP
jgi:hypothetical protein